MKSFFKEAIFVTFNRLPNAENFISKFINCDQKD